MRTLVVVISIAVIGSSLACGQSDTQAANHAELDRVVPRVPSGLSIGEVEERLGEPRTQYEVEGPEYVMVYGLWDLVFRPSLYKRTRYYLAGDWPAGRSVAPLDRDVRELPLESSRAEIERKLGKTEAWQVLEFRKRERVWYGDGRWKLSLRNGLLAGKENTEQVAEPSSP